MESLSQLSSKESLTIEDATGSVHSSGLFSQRHSGAGFGDSDRCFSVDDAIENVGLAIDELTVDDEATPAALALAPAPPSINPAPYPYNTFLHVTDESLPELPPHPSNVGAAGRVEWGALKLRSRRKLT